MDGIAEGLAQGLVVQLQTIPPNLRLLVGLSGVPASGKSSLAELVISKTNTVLSRTGETSDRAILIGLDGWHLTRAQLDALPDPVLAHAKRGAHWTFDGDSYVMFVKTLRESVDAYPIIKAPSFDHAVKDPEPNAVTILPCHRIVLIEGLYTFLSIPPWSDGGKLLDQRWFIQVDIDEAERRLVKRHGITGVATPGEEAVKRARDNDIPNGKFIIANQLEPTKRISSIDDLVLALPDA